MSNGNFGTFNGHRSLYSPETSHQTALYATLTPVVSVSSPKEELIKD
ncbi:hypothetical protein [Paenibacillus qinlingensis]|nr:hypothetical protein [Paenibacillus qinlingensis]NQX59251.1 hypothetical protein [Paenibacillus qinlingensis]